jgi:hypothetical protein
MWFTNTTDGWMWKRTSLVLGWAPDRHDTTYQTAPPA